MADKDKSENEASETVTTALDYTVELTQTVTGDEDVDDRRFAERVSEIGEAIEALQVKWAKEGSDDKIEVADVNF